MGFFSNLWNSTKSFFGQAASTSVGQAAASLSTIAQVAVSQADNMVGLNGTQKRNAALQIVASQAKSEGIAFTTGAINLAIELAFALLSESLKRSQR